MYDIIYVMANKEQCTITFNSLREAKEFAYELKRHVQYGRVISVKIFKRLDCLV